MTDSTAALTQPTIVETADDFFAKAGPMPSTFDDIRRFPRFYFRSCAEVTVFPFRGRRSDEPIRCFVVTRDLSRSGMGIVCSEELFPGQQLQITLNRQPERRLEVIWCRRLDRDNYACGCKFVAAPEPAST